MWPLTLREWEVWGVCRRHHPLFHILRSCRSPGYLPQERAREGTALHTGKPDKLRLLFIAKAREGYRGRVSGKPVMGKLSSQLSCSRVWVLLLDTITKKKKKAKRAVCSRNQGSGLEEPGSQNQESHTGDVTTQHAPGAEVHLTANLWQSPRIAPESF